MRNIYRRLLLLIAASTQRELARQVRCVKAENEILRSQLPKRVVVTEQERNRLVRFAAKLGRALGELVTIVHPDTLRRWIREAGKRRRTKPARVGRPRTREEIRRLILRLARENNWGLTRVLGELRKLGIRAISRNTVKNILKSSGFDDGPRRGVGTWDEFLKIHAATLWQCDFLSVRTLAKSGFRDLFLLVFLHVDSRRVFLSPATAHPNEAWVCDQPQAFVKHAKQTQLGVDIVMHDRDAKFTATFDAALKNAGLRVLKSSFRSPNTVAFVERFIQTLGQECLDYFFVFGERHLNYLVSQFVDYYHRRRPHQGKDNEVLVRRGRRRKPHAPHPPAENDVVPLAEVRCESRLGGLLKHYYRQAA